MLSGIHGLGETLILLWCVLRRSEQAIVDDSRTVLGAGRATDMYGIPPSEAKPAWLSVSVIAVLAILTWRRLGDHAVSRTEAVLRRWAR